MACSPGIGTLASEDPAFWPQAAGVGTARRGASQAWLLAPVPTCIKSSFSLEWPLGAECTKMGGGPGAREHWLPGSLLPHQHQS